jgi:monoamine oxidase
MQEQDRAGSPSPGAAPLDATVIVVGAGLSGLTAARELRRRDIDVLVLESADRVGGRAMGVTTSLGSRLDLGGQWIGADHHRISALAAELGLTQYGMHAEWMPHIIDRGRKISLLSPGALSAGAALAVVALLSRRGATERWNGVTLESWLRRVPGRTARRILEVIALTSWTADLDRYSIHAMLRMVRMQGGMRTMLSAANGAQDSLLVEGVGAIIDRLADELGPRVLTGQRVAEIGRDGSGVIVRTASRAFRAARVIVTAPPPVARRIVHDPPLPAHRHALERDTHMGSVYKAVAVFERPFWRDRARAEFFILDRPGRLVVDSTAPGGPGHLCMLASGPEARALDGLTAEERREILLAPLVPHLGGRIIDPVEWHERAWHLDEHVGGGYVVVPDPGTTAGIMPHAHLPVGNVHWAGAETASEHPGYLEGAIQSGERAAREVAAALPSPGAALTSRFDKK